MTRSSKKSSSGCLWLIGLFVLLVIVVPSSPDTKEGHNQERVERQEKTQSLMAKAVTTGRSIPVSKARPQTASEESKVLVVEDHSTEIDQLVKELKTIPARFTLENLRRYERLVKLDPTEPRYQSKRNYYAARLSPPMKVIGVHDGDSITLLTRDKKQIKVRLDGIDAPELKQEYGQKARRHLGDLLKTSKGGVRLEQMGKDKYGRTHGKIYLSDETYLNEKLVGDGFAWHFTKYNSDRELAVAHKQAKSGKRGIWAADLMPLPPNEFRERVKRKSTASKTARVSTARKRPAKKEVSTSHWLNIKSGVRHNARCQFFGRTSNGRACGPSAGRACKRCGGLTRSVGGCHFT